MCPFSSFIRTLQALQVTVFKGSHGQPHGFLKSSSRTAESLSMSWRMRSIAVVMASLGIVQLISSVAVWHWPQPKLFLLYLCMAALASAFQVRISGAAKPPLSANVPVILLGILQLGFP